MTLKEALTRYGVSAETIFKEAHAKYGEGFASPFSGYRAYCRWGVVPLYVHKHCRDLSRQVAVR